MLKWVVPPALYMLFLAHFWMGVWVSDFDTNGMPVSVVEGTVASSGPNP